MRAGIARRCAQARASARGSIFAKLQLFMRPNATSACFLSFLLPCISFSLFGQSKVPEKTGNHDTSAGPIFHVGGDVTAPKVIYAPEPEFSEGARKAGYQGTCVLSLIVDTNGRPKDIHLVRKLGMQLDEKAIQALRQWTFEPAQKGGRPVEVAIEVEFSFHLDNGESKTFTTEQYDQMRNARLQIQSQIYRTSGSEEPLGCPASSSDQKRPAVTLAELIFEGDLQMPSADRDRIAVSAQRGIYSGSLDEIGTEISERVRLAWQNSGYFTAQVHTDTRLLTSSPISERIAATVHVNEGQQYRLAGIRFQNNRALTNVKALRDLFPVKDGDILIREPIEQGMRDLHRLYGEYGYINLVSVPTTRIDEEKATVSLDIDLDEGKQFYISRVDVVGLDEAAFENLRQEMFLKPGDIYNQRIMELFLERTSRLPAFASFEPRYQLQINKTAGTVAMTYDFRHCHTD